MNEHYERRIDLCWLFYRILRSWRLIVLSSLIASIVIGGVILALNLKKISDPEYIAKETQAYEDQIIAINSATAELLNLRKSREEQYRYNENSILMQINPLREYNASFELYLDYDYQIMPELTYQNIDLSERILKAYDTYMSSGEMYRYILDNFDEITELRYLKEIFTVSADSLTNMISVSVRHTDPASCEQLLELAKTGIFNKCPEISEAIDAHTLILTNASSYEAVNLELEELQKTNLSIISELDKKIKEKEALKKTATEQSVVSELTTTWAIKNTVKYLVLTVIGFAFLVAMLIACYCILSGKLMNPVDIRYRFGLRIIAQLPKKRTKKPFAFISRWISRLGGITLVPEDYARLTRMAGISIKSALTTKTTEKEWTSIAFSGGSSEEDLQTLIDATGLSESYTTINAADILTNAASIEKATTADCAVLVVEQERTLLIDVAKELEALKAWGIPVLGVIITNTDAVM